MSVFTKLFFLVFILLISTLYSDAKNVDKLLAQERQYYDVRIKTSKMMKKWFPSLADRYAKRITNSQKKLDTLTDIGTKDKEKILAQITKNVDERIKDEKIDIKKQEKKMQDTQDKILKYAKNLPSVSETYKKVLKMQKALLKYPNDRLKKFNDNRDNLVKEQQKWDFAKEIINNSKVKSKFSKWNAAKFAYEQPVPPRVINNQLPLPRTDQNRKPPKVAIETPRKKPKRIFVKAISTPKQINPTKHKIVNQGNGKTVLKNVNILTTAKTGNINTKGKLNVANIKVAKGTTLKNTNINADVNVKNISVSKGSTADIGSVNITK